MIDFSTLRGLTIPEGNVTQIVDASGKVIWRAKKERVGKLYMRPSVDISLEHMIYPSSLLHGYLAICEEVSDDGVTYIGVKTDTKTSNPSDVNATSTFGLTITDEVIVNKVLSAKIVCIEYTLGGKENAAYQDITCSIGVNGTEVGSGFKEIRYEANGTQFFLTNTLDNIDMSQFISIVNQYIQENRGNLPTITLTVQNRAYASGAANSSTSGLTQAYIELECEYID